MGFSDGHDKRPSVLAIATTFLVKILQPWRKKREKKGKKRITQYIYITSGVSPFCLAKKMETNKARGIHVKPQPRERELAGKEAASPSSVDFDCWMFLARHITRVWPALFITRSLPIKSTVLFKRYYSTRARQHIKSHILPRILRFCVIDAYWHDDINAWQVSSSFLVIGVV